MQAFSIAMAWIQRHPSLLTHSDIHDVAHRIRFPLITGSDFKECEEILKSIYIKRSHPPCNEKWSARYNEIGTRYDTAERYSENEGHTTSLNDVSLDLTHPTEGSEPILIHHSEPILKRPDSENSGHVAKIKAGLGIHNNLTDSRNASLRDKNEEVLHPCSLFCICEDIITEANRLHANPGLIHASGLKNKPRRSDAYVVAIGGFNKKERSSNR